MTKITRVLGVVVIIFIVFFLIFFLVLYTTKVNSLTRARKEQNSQNISDEEDLKTYIQRTIKGKVVGNSHACQVDGSCYLIIETEGKGYIISYGGGFKPSQAKSLWDNICLSKNEKGLIWDLTVGQEVEVSGPVSRNGRFYTCPDNVFTINTVK